METLKRANKALTGYSYSNAQSSSSTGGISGGPLAQDVHRAPCVLPSPVPLRLAKASSSSAGSHTQRLGSKQNPGSAGVYVLKQIIIRVKKNNYYFVLITVHFVYK